MRSTKAEVAGMPNSLLNNGRSEIHCVQKKTPTHIFFRISMNDV